ncbi:hypothetical protein PanWU01x14_238000 [Parasponia andersonii]|uniref:Uncharacterized protein n=1 Tax=Parasponia andersonii TaxID=3476 RepID=A0A2P5BHK1_PARAD|nr:hypothetical protein PanWU01x14_238000 [Parasponia andersonii]
MDPAHFTSLVELTKLFFGNKDSYVHQGNLNTLHLADQKQRKGRPQLPHDPSPLPLAHSLKRRRLSPRHRQHTKRDLRSDLHYLRRSHRHCPLARSVCCFNGRDHLAQSRSLPSLVAHQIRGKMTYVEKNGAQGYNGKIGKRGKELERGADATSRHLSKLLRLTMGRATSWDRCVGFLVAHRQDPSAAGAYYHRPKHKITTKSFNCQRHFEVDCEPASFDSSRLLST